MPEPLSKQKAIELGLEQPPSPVDPVGGQQPLDAQQAIALGLEQPAAGQTELDFSLSGIAGEYLKKRQEQEGMRKTKTVGDAITNAILDVPELAMVPADVLAMALQETGKAESVVGKVGRFAKSLGESGIEFVKFMPHMLSNLYHATGVNATIADVQVAVGMPEEVVGSKLAHKMKRTARKEVAKHPLFHTIGGAFPIVRGVKFMRQKPKLISKPPKPEMRLEEKIYTKETKIPKFKNPGEAKAFGQKFKDNKQAIEQLVAKERELGKKLEAETNIELKPVLAHERQMYQEAIEVATGKGGAAAYAAKKAIKTEEIKDVELRKDLTTLKEMDVLGEVSKTEIAKKSILKDVGEGEKLYFVDPAVQETVGVIENIKKAISGKPTSEANAAMKDIAHERTGDIAFGEYKAEGFRNEGINKAVRRVVANRPKLERLKAVLKGKSIGSEIKRDLIHYVQKTGDPFRKGDTFESLSKRLPEKAKTIGKNIRVHLDEMWKAINESGFINDVEYVENYLTGMYAGNKKKIKNVANIVRNFDFSKQKKYANYHEAAIKGGLTPRFFDVGQIINYYENLAYRVMANNKMLTKIKQLRTPDGKGLMYRADKVPKLTEGEYRELRHSVFKRLYTTKEGKARMQDNVFVHPEIYKPLKNVLDTGFDFSKSKWASGIRAVNAVTKKTMLTLSAFHHFALTESAVATGRFNIPAGIKHAKELMKRMDETVEVGIRNGLQITPTSDIHLTTFNNMIDGLIRHTERVPILRQGFKTLKWVNDKWDRALWDFYHRSLKVDAFHRIYTENLQKHGETLSEKQIARESANFVNDAFGGQNWDGYLNVNNMKKGQQLAQLLLLAPDWSLSNLKIAARGVAGLGRFGPKTVNKKALGYWARAGTMFTVGQQMAQYGFWQANLSEEEKKKYSPWMWDNAPGEKWNINTFTRDEKGRWIMIKPLKQAREVVRYISNFHEIVGNKLSPIAREAVEFISGHSPGSQFKQPYADLEGWDRVKGWLKHAITKPVPLSLKGQSYLMAIPKRSAMNNYKAVKLFSQELKRYAEGEDTIGYLEEIKKHAKDNNLDTKILFTTALSSVRGYYYSEFFKALNNNNMKRVDELAKGIAKLNADTKDVKKSLDRKFNKMLRENQLDMSRAEVRAKIRKAVSNIRKYRDRSLNKFQRKIEK